MPHFRCKRRSVAHVGDLVFFLRPPMEAYSSTQVAPTCDRVDIPMLGAEDGESPAVSF